MPRAGRDRGQLRNDGGLRVQWRRWLVKVCTPDTEEWMEDQTCYRRRTQMPNGEVALPRVMRLGSSGLPSAWEDVRSSGLHRLIKSY